ncbi:MAG TPA: VWA domain-containing protein [Pyrinomonadaceae bacterium]|nr:VWA domain-containing protein [Pyrinomonadaceae bacterium]
MMKSVLYVFMVTAAVAATALAQSNATRPRVVPTPMPTPAPAAPVIQGEVPETVRRGGPPIFSGEQGRRPQPTPTPEVADDDSDVIKIETNLITMPVSVLDREGRFVTGLQQRDFRIYENGVEQKVDYFQSVEQPFTVVLMIDVSPSTQFRMDQIHSSAIAFVDQLRENDRVMVVAFDDRYRVLCRPTNDKRILRNAITQAQWGNGTSLYEAVDRVISRELSQISGRKAVVLFTDGVDTTSRRATYDSTVADVEEIDALFYTIRYDTQQDGFGGGGWGGNRFPRRGGGRTGGGLGDIIGIIIGGGNFPVPGQGPGTGRPRGGPSNEYETGRRYLETIAQNSGGRSFEADTTANLDAAFTGIAEELRRQYSLGYYPERVGEVGERKQIRVRVMRPNLVVRAKNSYVVGQNTPKPSGV